MILDKPVGTNGFGYDPIFYYPPLNKTFAQLSPDEKNTVSHRGQAMRKLGNDLKRILAWLEGREM
ncbi:MAG: non-canonical purine NTP pyrophosphatase [Desulfatiglandales bacterium]